MLTGLFAATCDLSSPLRRSALCLRVAPEERRPDRAPPPGVRSYLTDDADIDSARHRLDLARGENGDWYLSVLPSADRSTRACVRITTSGSRRHGMPNAIHHLWQALSDDARASELDPMTIQTCVELCEKHVERAASWDWKVREALNALAEEMRAMLGAGHVTSNATMNMYELAELADAADVDLAEHLETPTSTSGAASAAVRTERVLTCRDITIMLHQSARAAAISLGLEVQLAHSQLVRRNRQGTLPDTEPVREWLENYRMFLHLSEEEED